MRKHTNSLTHTPRGSGDDFFITPSKAESPLWNEDIYNCLPFGKREPGLVLIICDCALRLSSSSAAAHYQKTHTHLFDLLYIFPSPSTALTFPPPNETCSQHHVEITSGPSSLNSLWRLSMGWSVRSRRSFGPGPIKAIESSAFFFCLWSVVWISALSGPLLIISDSKALHTKSTTAFMAAAGAAWGICFAAIENIISGAWQREKYGICVICVPLTPLGY